MKLDFQKPLEKGGPSIAELSYENGDEHVATVLGVVQKGKAQSDFGEIDCWEFQPDADAPELDRIQKKTKREVCSELSRVCYLRALRED